MSGKDTPAQLLRRKQKIQPPEGYVTRLEAADRIHRSKSTLDKYAIKRRHFNFKKIGRYTFYKVEDLEQFNKRKQTF